ncbi:protein PRR14L-like [Elgaria multicarinata webbii]|uniref:protein PRR14L-like n=1 Tax=Elgaria multicarinata webbii TaxID=159646 RepID=UPI002FCD232E
MGAREGRLLPSSTSPKSPSQIAARHRFQLLGAVSLPARPAGLSSHGTVASWAQPPKQSGSRSSSLGSSRLRSRAKEPAVLFRRLSALADSLLAPRRDPQALKPRLHSTQLLPVTATHSQLRIKKLQEMVSCTKMKLSAAWVNGGRCCCRFEVFSSQPTALYPIASASLCFFELSNRTPLAFSAPVFPVSFHVKMDSRPGRTLSGVTPLHSIPSSLALGEARTVQSPKWTFSFLLPQRCLSTAPIQNEAWIPAESYTPSAQSLSAAKERGREAAAVAPSCPTRGLQTALALFSPGCYRVWTRKRNLSSRLPAAQKLTLLQLPRGVKGLKCPTPVSADLFPLLPSSLGRGLCPWSQHGPSTCPSEFTPLHSNRCKWQPSTRRSLRNSSAPLSLVRDPFMEASRAVDDAMRLKPSFAAPLPMSCSVPEPAPSPALGFPVPGFQVHPLDELDVSVPAVPKAGARLGKAELEKRPKKVSQIRIRKTVPKPDPNLTPMGLPRPKRLKKTEFSLEEIYTNKNYKSPPTTRCLETIFEEPKEKNGSLISVSQQKRKRILEFQDFTVPRKRKARNRVKVMGSFTRAQKAAMEGRELDVLLLQKLTDLEMFFAKEEEQEQASGS